MLLPTEGLMRELCCAIAIAAAVLQDGAQSPPPASSASVPPTQRSVFRVATRLVQVNVVVHDEHGAPVTDLKKEDFTVLERGKPQSVSFFAMESADKLSRPAASLPPHIFSNVFAERAGVPTSITVVLLDLLNTSWVDQQYARRGLMTFLKQVQPQDRIGIYALGAHSLTLLHDYTTDASSLVTRLKADAGELPSVLDASTLNPDAQQELRDLDLGALADANQREADFFTTGRVLNTLSTLEAIAQHLSGVPGRKNLIWLSGGFPLTIGYDAMPTVGSTRDSRTFTAEMNAAVRALNNSGVSVYPVDARGLMVTPGFDASHRTINNNVPMSVRMAPIRDNIDGMRELADRTGGRAAVNTNDLGGAVRRAIDDARVTYTIGYYPSDETQDGRFRDIRIKVNRPHLDVRYRKGYFALKPPNPADNKTRQAETRAAVWSPLESTAIALNARADLTDDPEPNSVNVLLQIDPSGLDFRNEEGRWKASLDVVYVQKDEHGKVLAGGVTDAMTLAFTEANYAKLAQEGLMRARRLPRKPGASTLRIVVRDVGNGAIGSLTIPFTQIQAEPRPR
jgi:VWFA-related protein